MEKLVQGKAYYIGDFVNTDVMSPGRFEPFGDNEELARIALIDYESDIPFVNPETGKSDYRVIFAGHECGCGSSRETAPMAMGLAGATVIIARSFARIFHRNCINLGIMLPIVYDHPFDEAIIGEEVIVNIAERYFQVGDQKFEFGDFGPLTDIIEAGGLTPYNQKRIAEGLIQVR